MKYKEYFQLKTRLTEDAILEAALLSDWDTEFVFI